MKVLGAALLVLSLVVLFSHLYVADRSSLTTEAADGVVGRSPDHSEPAIGQPNSSQPRDRWSERDCSESPPQMDPVQLVVNPAERCPDCGGYHDVPRFRNEFRSNSEEAQLTYNDVIERAMREELSIRGLDTLYLSAESGIEYRVLAFAEVNVVQYSDWEDEDGVVHQCEPYKKTAYSTDVGIYDESGVAVDMLHGIDRLTDIAAVRLSLESPLDSDYLLLDRGFEGSALMAIDESGHLVELVFASCQQWGSGSAHPDFMLLDPDHDGAYEAVVFLTRCQGAHVRFESTYLEFRNTYFPDGTPLEEVRTGVVAVELAGETEPPFTYYTELVLR